MPEEHHFLDGACVAVTNSKNKTSVWDNFNDHSDHVLFCRSLSS